jgi:hypothetical protein
MKIRHFLSGIFVLLCFTFNTLATVHYVAVSSTNPVSPYLSWATAATNIQDAIIAAASGDTVLVTNGIYPYGNTQGSRIAINSGQTVQSVNGPTFTTIQGYQIPGTTNGSSAVRCANLVSGATLSGFTLTGGATSNFGFDGGGVYCQSTNCLVTNCVITGNAALLGGGAYSGTVVNCKVIGNSAINSGWGGGVYNGTLINCLLTGNVAGYRGGAAQNATLINCTVIGNTGQPDSLDGCKIKNSISYYNSPDNGDSSGDNNYFTNCCVPSVPAFNSANIITNPPLFANLSGGDYHLNAASCCINAGNNSFITNTTDLDGNPRIVGGTVDIGVYEFQSPVHYVNLANATPVSPFTSWITAAANIQDAVDAASAGDSIVVSNGIYNSGGRAVYGVATNRVTVDKAVTVQSVNGAAATIIAGSLFNLNSGVAARCVYLTNGAVLSGFTLTNGGTPPVLGDLAREASGGGVWCEDNSAVISNCVLTGNYSSRYGGGAFGGTLINCTLTNNSAARGGGSASNTLINCVLTHNMSALLNLNYGGGAYGCILSNCLLVGNQSLGGSGFGAGASFSTLTSCVLSNNNTSGNGGGIYFGVVNNSLISSNSAYYGGGAYSNTLINCLLKNNLASSGGGAYGSVLVNCTTVSNTASAGGGGVAGGAVTNSIVYDNNGGNIFNTKNVAYTCTIPAFGDAGVFSNAPLFVDESHGDFHLQSSSPCINAGNNSSVAGSTDLDGNPRIVGGTVDIGAYEFQSPDSVIFNVYLQAPTNASSGITISWQSVNGVNYFIQRSGDLTEEPPFLSIQSNIIGQAGTTSFTDTTATNPVPYFYRVGVQK